MQGYNQLSEMGFIYRISAQKELICGPDVTQLNKGTEAVQLHKHVGLGLGN